MQLRLPGVNNMFGLFCLFVLCDIKEPRYIRGLSLYKAMQRLEETLKKTHGLELYSTRRLLTGARQSTAVHRANPHSI